VEAFDSLSCSEGQARSARAKWCVCWPLRVWSGQHAGQRDETLQQSQRQLQRGINSRPRSCYTRSIPHGTWSSQCTRATLTWCSSAGDSASCRSFAQREDCSVLKSLSGDGSCRASQIWACLWTRRKLRVSMLRLATY